jgi:hypothetical protein
MEDLGFGENTIQQVAKHTETSLMNFIEEKEQKNGLKDMDMGNKSY